MHCCMLHTKQTVGADWFDLDVVVKPQTGQRTRAGEVQFSLSSAVSAKHQVETIQIGFNLCFALTIIDRQSCVANGDEWALGG